MNNLSQLPRKMFYGLVVVWLLWPSAAVAIVASDTFPSKDFDVATSSHEAIEAGQVKTQNAVDQPDTEIRSPARKSFELLKQYGLLAVALHFVVFASLLIAARYSPIAWRVLSDPVGSKSGLWLWIIIRYSTLVQRYLFARWYKHVAKQTLQAEYLAVPILRSDGKTLLSDTFLATVNRSCRIWVLGRAGMGKTAMLANMREQYFAPNKSLSDQIKNYGFIPIFISLRDYVAVPVPTKSPEDWIVEIVARELEHHKLAFGDINLLKIILKSGDFVLVMDGENEVNDKGAIGQFAKRFPETGLVISSQTAPTMGTADYDVMSLPVDIKAVLQDLICLYLGDQEGAQVFEAVRLSTIVNAIRSGYDVRLLADLVIGGLKSTEIPQTRIGLFDAMLAKLQAVDHSEYDMGALCRAAWQLWIKGQRRFESSELLSDDEFRPLQAQNIRIVYTLDGKTWQFRHDEMRGFLAASWAGRFEVSPVDLFQAAPEIWRISQSDQQLVWSFFAEMVAEEKLIALTEWAAADPQKAQLHNSILRRRATQSSEVGDGIDILDLQDLDQLRIEVGYGLLTIFRGDQTFDITDQIHALRQQLFVEMGFVLPSVRILDNMQLRSQSYRIKIKECALGNGEIRPNKMLALKQPEATEPIPGEKVLEPVFGLSAQWIDKTDSAAARDLHYTVVDSQTVITTHLTELIKKNMAQLLHYSDVEQLLKFWDSQEIWQLAETIKHKTRPTVILEVMQDLLSERIPIRDVPTILEAISSAIDASTNFAEIVEIVRSKLSLTICRIFADADGTICCWIVSENWQQFFEEESKKYDGVYYAGVYEGVGGTEVKLFCDRLAAVARSEEKGERNLNLMTSPKSRRLINYIVRNSGVNVPVFSTSELSVSGNVYVCGEID